jgi:hypothetical protein
MIAETPRRVTGTQFFYRRREISNRAGAYTCKTKRKDRFWNGQIVIGVLFANKPRGWLIISSSIVVSPFCIWGTIKECIGIPTIHPRQRMVLSVSSLVEHDGGLLYAEFKSSIFGYLASHMEDMKRVQHENLPQQSYVPTSKSR